MDAIYYDISHPAAFGGSHILQRATGKSAKEVSQFLSKQDVYRKFRVPKSKFKRARITVHTMSTQFQSDLFDLQKLKLNNSGFKWILLVVDAFSRYVKCQPLKDKSGQQVAAGLDIIYTQLIKENRLAPRSLLSTDLGNEFYNKLTDQVFVKYGVAHIPLRPPIKCALAEISGRYIVEKLYKAMAHEKTKRWIDNLQAVVNAKNNRKSNKTAGLAPSEINYDNQEEVRKKLYPKIDVKPFAFELGDRVQIIKTRLLFGKSYHGYLNDKTYRIVKRHKMTVPRYSLVDEYDDEPITGTWYAEELLKL